MIQQSDSINELATALAKAQGTFVDPEHDGKVDFTDKSGRRVNYTYATLGAVLKEVRPKLAAHGLSITQFPYLNHETRKIEVMTQLMHSSGQWLRGSFGLDHSNGKPQEQAGIITYERRYALSPILGISAEADTDGAQSEEEKKSANNGQNKNGNTNNSGNHNQKKQQNTDPKIYRATPEQNAKLRAFFETNAPALTQEDKKKIAGELLGKDMDTVQQLLDAYIDQKAYETAQGSDFELPENFR